jgi:FdhD protein
MENEIEKFPVIRFTKEGQINTNGVVAKEFPVTIILNDQELVTMLCSPDNMDHLAVGFLSSEGLIKSKDEIKRIIVDKQRGVVRLKTVTDELVSRDVLFKRLITSGCGKGSSFYREIDITDQKITSKIKISTSEVFALVHQFQHGSELYLTTHGVHSAALCDTKRILVFSEDIGRHNAIDKIFGKCLLEGIPVDDRLLITSGRMSSEILHKVVKKGIPIIVSISAPTDMGVKLAEGLGITLVGSVRGKKMNVYTNKWRIIYSGD